jgi:hypothetical protein
MHDKSSDQQPANENVELAPARDGFWRQPVCLERDVKSELQAHAGGKHPTIEKARIAKRGAVDRYQPKKSEKENSDPQNPGYPADEMSCRT